MASDPRAAILARRARFVAAAVATLGFAAGCEKGTGPSPQTCLTARETPPDPSTTADPKASTNQPPSPCLEPMPADAAVVGDAGTKKHMPSICLSDDTY